MSLDCKQTTGGGGGARIEGIQGGGGGSRKGNVGVAFIFRRVITIVTGSCQCHYCDNTIAPLRKDVFDGS